MQRVGAGRVSSALERVLARTGFTGGPEGDAVGLRRAGDPLNVRLEAAFAERGGLAADAVYESEDGPKLIVKAVGGRHAADADALDALHERAWNLGLAPLLWIVTPVEVRVYDAYRGVGMEEDRGPLAVYGLDVEAQMAELDAFCGRFSLDTGAFWSSALARDISRDGKVDNVLLGEIRALEQRLVAVSARETPNVGLADARERCQELITCTLFASYLFDRGLAGPMLPPDLGDDLASILRSREGTLRLLAWLHDTFNGDVFPADIGQGLLDGHLGLLEDFANGTHLHGWQEGQMRLFRFRFDTVPIELISSVYESFAQRAASDMSRDLGVHYTRVELVHMALDPVFEGLPDGATVLDPTCGSGLFLVQSLRRLVWKRCGDGPRPRSLVREILYGQVHGIDVQTAALRIAAFSLYLAALELETEARPGEAIGFRHLVGLTLHRLDFLSAEAFELSKALKPDAIVGNPPWTHGVVDLPRRGKGPADLDAELFARRSPDQRFLSRAIDVMGRSGRIAMYVKAAPLLARSPEATSFREALLRRLDRLAMLNMSPLRHDRLFADAQSPGLLLCANCGNLPDGDRVLVGTFPWTPDYSKSGALALSSADVSVVEKARVLATPSFLKAAMVGTPRDALLMERIERDGIPLGTLLDKMGVRSGRGFQVEGGRKTPVPKDMAEMPALWKTPEYRPGRLDGLPLPTLAERKLTELWRVRDLHIYSPAQDDDGGRHHGGPSTHPLEHRIGLRGHAADRSAHDRRDGLLDGADPGGDPGGLRPGEGVGPAAGRCRRVGGGGRGRAAARGGRVRANGRRRWEAI